MKNRYSRIWSARLLVITLVLVAWEGAARLWADPMFVAPPSGVAAAIPALLGDAQIIRALLTAFVEIIVAFVLAAIIGTIVGLTLGLSSLPRRSLLPIVFVLYAVPQSIIMPLFVLFLGIGPEAKIAFGFSHGVFAVILSVASGVQSIEPALRRAAYSMGARKWQVLASVILPHVVPSLFTGLRLCMTGVILGVLLAELYVSVAGVGHYTHRFTERFQPDNLFAFIALLAAMAVLLNSLCSVAEARFTRWHR